MEAAVESFTDHPTWVDVDLSPRIEARYLRFNVESYYDNGGGINEIEVYAVPATPSPTPLPTATPTPPPTPAPTSTPTATPTPPPTPTPTPTPSVTPVPAPTSIHLVVDWDDYNGDGTGDIAVYDPDSGEWSIENITSGVIWGGGEGDIPTPGD